MDITRRTDYAIRVLRELVGATTPVSVRTLSQNQGVPYAFARAIQADLARSGLIEVTRGARGGAVLSRSAEDISLLDIAKATQGKTSCSVCTRDPAWCTLMPGCKTHGVWKELDRITEEFLSHRKLSELVD